MEDTLREFGNVIKIILLSVLILVLMEDTLRGQGDRHNNNGGGVLILVLMEDTLRAMNNFSVTGYICLNPCFNGRYSQSQVARNNYKTSKGLNPCFNGRYSQREQDIRIFCISGIGIYKTNSACSC